VAVFHSHSATPHPDPFLYLHGGPGGHILNQVPLGVVEQFDNVLADRDVILFDQRGVGYSEPALDCPEVTRHFYETLNENLSPTDAIAQEVAARVACRDRLLTEGVNLAAYTTTASAADVEDLRHALGYPQWNLYGISYGTRLALTVMRDYPQGVRSAILDSTAPLDVDFFADLAPNAQHAFNLLFNACAADPACNAAYPDLKTVFYGLVAQLTVEPVKLHVLNLFTGQFYTVDFDGEDAVDFLFDLLYDTSTIPLLPEIIYAAAGGDFTEVAQRLELSLIEPAFVSEAAPYSVWCSEESPFTTPELVAAADLDVDQPIRDTFDATVQTFFDTCAVWGAVAADPIEDQPVASDIPTLILAGQLDPITPPAWGRRVADNLSRAYFYEFPGTGHGIVYAHRCGQAMAEAFLVDPSLEPDAGCVDQPGLYFETP
jgi:pimeloyl-ACP methyl ester carboxylesterase